MALDRQRILNELGSVMSQLKSADCGCMGKLFGGAGQATASPSPLPTCGGCRRNCCYGHGHGWNANGSCGEQYQGNAPNMNTPCMGRCNPSKLYADTYNYLTDNIMQPTVKEVYDDLKSLSPDNCIANNPMANQMGLSPNSLATQGKIGEMSNMSNMNAGSCYNNFSSQPATAGYIPTNDINLNQMGQVGGLGPQIMNMVKGNMTKQNKINPNVGQNSPLTGPGQIGVTPISAPMTNNQDIYNASSQGYPTSYNTDQIPMQPNMRPAGYVQYTGNNNPATQQIAAGHSHGHHSQGIAKFNEMFPGVVNNIGGNLGFDPMAIAIQMNPANQNQTAMNTMNKMMRNNHPNEVFDQSANPASLAGKGIQQNQIQNVSPNQVQKSIPSLLARNETVQQNVTPTNQMTHQNGACIYNNPDEQIYNQQVYTASSGEPVPNQQTSQPQQNHQQNIIDPNTGSAMVPLTLASAYEATLGQQAINPESQDVQRIIKEPILPTDTTKFVAPRHPKYFEYNTLGQPVEKCSAEMYRTIEPSLPQTLSPQLLSNTRTDAAKYSNVKSTMSKTSLMGAKTGRTPTQLQQIYNQYKGSQSYTQQNIAAVGVNAVSHSEGKLNAPEVSRQHRQIPVEKVGDTMVSNQIRNERTVKVEQVMGQIGDVPAANKPMSDKKPDEMAPVIKRNTRNGLQDVVYTSYPSSAWIFHGVRSSPCRPGRNRYSR